MPGVLLLHGGGYALGNPEGFGDVYRMLMDTRACVIVAPEAADFLREQFGHAVDGCFAKQL